MELIHVKNFFIINDMPIQVNINGITGQSPYDIYVCQSDGTGCFYMLTTSNTSLSFTIPSPYDESSSYLLKVIDSNECIITGVQTVST
jgi:hypothetical protein